MNIMFTVREWLWQFIDNSPIYNDFTPKQLIDEVVLSRPIIDSILDADFKATDLPFQNQLVDAVSEAAESIRKKADNYPPEIVEGDQVDLDFSEAVEGEILPPVPIKESFLSTVQAADIDYLLGQFEKELRENQEIMPLIQEETQLVDDANSIVVSNGDSFKEAVKLAKQINSDIETIKAIVDPVAAKAFQFHRGITTIRSRLTGGLGKALAIFRQKSEKYQYDERIRAEREQAAARAAALEENRKEQEALREKAEKAIAAGKEIKAKSLFEEADNLSPQIPTVPQPEKIKEVSFAKDSKVSVIEGRELDVLRAIIAGNLPIGAIEFKIGVLKTDLKNNKVTVSQAEKWGILLEHKSTLR